MRSKQEKVINRVKCTHPGIAGQNQAAQLCGVQVGLAGSNTMIKQFKNQVSKAKNVDFPPQLLNTTAEESVQGRFLLLR
ncbi:MAG: hypothetical protein D3925_11435 [Candidatus Electrothrix sp. AR5]|nr:hypothetical protein [Candidatus Electrothrix sp. AR5]